MKYVLMYASNRDLVLALPSERLEEVSRQVYAWFEKYGESIVEMGAELQAPDTATTLRTGDDGVPVVVDGPYIEAKELIAGFSIIDVPDLEGALSMVREWPYLGLEGASVEIRPIVDHSMDYPQSTM